MTALSPRCILVTICLRIFTGSMAGQTVKIDIDALAVIEGKLPARALGLVIQWATLHQQEPREAFLRAANMAEAGKIDSLPLFARP